MLRAWHKLGLPACERLNARIRPRDRRLFTVFNQRERRFEVWIRTNSHGPVPVLLLQGAGGEYVNPDTHWREVQRLLEAADLAGRGRRVVEEIFAHNDRLQDRAWDEMTDRLVDDGLYFQRRIAQEAAGGTPRGSVDDALRGYRNRWV